MSVLYRDIAELVTNDAAWAGSGDAPDVARLGVLTDAAVVVEHGRVAWLGSSSVAPQADSCVSLAGRAVLPAFVDAHTHLVFAGDRAAEFGARMTGSRYDGGGIANTVGATRDSTDAELDALLAGRVREMAAQGTGQFEVKSGYGLTVEDELRLLRVARRHTPHVTLLGAHVVPPEFASRRSDYVSLVTGPMLAEAAEVQADGAPLAQFVDVFCEPASAHAFDGDESREVLEAGRAAGLALRVHGNQLAPGPGVALACELGAASVDHCTYLSPADVEALVGAAETTCATLLPGVELSTRSPFPDARALVDAGVRVALATDCNPGTCYSTSMPLVIALAVTMMRLSPAEAVWAATAEPGRSLGVQATVAVGEPARLTVLDAPSHVHLAYRPGVPIARLLEISDVETV